MTLTAPAVPSSPAFDSAASAAESQLEALETKIHRALEKLTQARDENARLKQVLDERDQQLAALQRETLSERTDVRTRVEKLLKQVDAMTRDE